MSKDLQNDMFKLVRYKVLFVKRGYEHAFSEQEELVSENTDDAAYTAWKIAEFNQELRQGKTAIPRTWLEKGYPPSEYVQNGQLLEIPDDDKRYLRVYYEVLEQYTREQLKYNEDQDRELERIKDALREK